MNELTQFLEKFKNKSLLLKVTNHYHLRYYGRLNIPPKKRIKVLLKHYQSINYQDAIQDIWKIIIN